VQQGNLKIKEFLLNNLFFHNANSKNECRRCIVHPKRISLAIKEYNISSELGAIRLSPSIGVACTFGEQHKAIKSLKELLSHAVIALYTSPKGWQGTNLLVFRIGGRDRGGSFELCIFFPVPPRFRLN